jgi:hypothetical protein
MIFEIRGAAASGFCARPLGHAIFTEAESWDDRRAIVPLSKMPADQEEGRPETIVCPTRPAARFTGFSRRSR